MSSSYRLGRTLKAGQRDRRDYVTYLSSIPGELEGGAPSLDPPTLVDGFINAGFTLITLEYSKVLDPDSAPPLDAYTISVDGDETGEVLAVTILGNLVHITTVDAVTQPGDITLTYVVGSPALAALNGPAAEAFADFPIALPE